MVLGERSNDAEVDEPDPAVLHDDEVPGVWVGVEETLAEDLREGDAERHRGEVVAILEGQAPIVWCSGELGTSNLVHDEHP